MREKHREVQQKERKKEEKRENRVRKREDWKARLRYEFIFQGEIQIFCVVLFMFES